MYMEWKFDGELRKGISSISISTTFQFFYVSVKSVYACVQNKENNWYVQNKSCEQVKASIGPFYLDKNIHCLFHHLVSSLNACEAIWYNGKKSGVRDDANLTHEALRRKLWLMKHPHKKQVEKKGDSHTCFHWDVQIQCVNM